MKKYQQVYRVTCSLKQQLDSLSQDVSGVYGELLSCWYNSVIGL